MSTTAPIIYGDGPPPEPPPPPPEPKSRPITTAGLTGLADIGDDLYQRALFAVINAPGVPANLDTIRGTMVRLSREDLGLGQVELARMVPTTQQSISRIEMGTQVPTDDLRVRIARALGVTTARLFLYADEMGKP